MPRALEVRRARAPTRRSQQTTGDSERRALQNDALQLSADTGPARSGYDFAFHDNRACAPQMARQEQASDDYGTSWHEVRSAKPGICREKT